MNHSDHFENGGPNSDQIFQRERKNTLTSDEIIDPLLLGCFNSEFDIQ
jgi:hypothetical protein